MSHQETQRQEEAVRSAISYWRDKRVAMYGPPLAEWFPPLEGAMYSYLVRYPDPGYNVITTLRENIWQITPLEEAPLLKMRTYFLAKTSNHPEHKRQSYEAEIKTMHENQLRHLLGEGWLHLPKKRI